MISWENLSPVFMGRFINRCVYVCMYVYISMTGPQVLYGRFLRFGYEIKDDVFLGLILPSQKGEDTLGTSLSH